MRALAYKAGAVLNTGFAPAAVTMEAVEAGGVPGAAAASPLVAYARLIELDAGDSIELTLYDPRGDVLAQTKVAPLATGKAQYLTYVGKKAPAGGWPRGALRRRRYRPSRRRRGAVNRFENDAIAAQAKPQAILTNTPCPSGGAVSAGRARRTTCLGYELRARRSPP